MRDASCQGLANQLATCELRSYVFCSGVPPCTGALRLRPTVASLERASELAVSRLGLLACSALIQALFGWFGPMLLLRVIFYASMDLRTVPAHGHGPKRRCR